jgi:23S rRNA (guanosine2251-2'-O)-methyltransferase
MLREILDAHRDTERGVLLLLDGVQDPQNLGSILRAAECFGVEAVVWSRNRGVPVTPSVVKASAGASELVTLVEVGNINDAIGKCRDAGWWILGASVTGNATAVQSYQGPQKVALVMGAEGSGLKNLTQRNVDQTVYIPMRGRIDSLNVGQATAVLLSWIEPIRGKH